MEETINHLQIHTISKGYYQVIAITDEDKICLEGKVCGGILKELLKNVKVARGKIIRSKKPLFSLEDVSQIKQLKSELKDAESRIEKAVKLLK